MQFENIKVQIADGVAVVTIDRPAVLNALDAQTTREIGAAAAWLDGLAEVRALIVTGAGDKAFVAGADIRMLATLDPEGARAAAREGQQAFDRLESMGKPVIAAINGFALGGGCELALACHVRIASEKARIGLPEINLGVLPGHGGTQRLPRLVGMARAIELVASGRHVDAAEAERIGLVNEVVAPERLMERARELAAVFAAKPPVAMRYALAAVREGLQGAPGEGMALEAGYFGLAFATQDQTEGMSAFLEKRKPQWKGR